VDDSPTRWTDLLEKVKALNVDGKKCKIIFAGRHGQGVHNLAETKYGTKAWNEYWSKLTTDGALIWGPDPKLTSVGEQEALAVHARWIEELNASGLTIPQSFYASPLQRTAHTADLTFSALPGVGTPFSAFIVENIREVYGEHTCDMRRTYTDLQNDFPSFSFEKTFTEEDELWTPIRESDTHLDIRVRDVLDRVFESDDSLFISITSHGGWISGLLRVTGHQDYNLPTGGVQPLIIQATHPGSY